MASHGLVTFLFNIDCLELTREVTFYQYVYAVNSGRLIVYRILPLDCPSIQVESSFECCPLRKLKGVLHSSVFHEFTQEKDAAACLADFQLQFLCRHCEKRLFNLITCVEHEVDYNLFYETRILTQNSKFQIQITVKILNSLRCLRQPSRCHITNTKLRLFIICCPYYRAFADVHTMSNCTKCTGQSTFHSKSMYGLSYCTSIVRRLGY